MKGQLVEEQNMQEVSALFWLVQVHAYLTGPPDSSVHLATPGHT